MRIYSKRLEATNVGEEDEKVLNALSATMKKDIEGSTAFTAGIRNSEGIVYREVTLYGLNQAMGFANRMDKAGFIDEMPDDGGQIDGYDTTFRLKGK